MRWLLLCIGACVVCVVLNAQLSGGATTQKLSWTILQCSYKLLYDFNIYTDHGIAARRPDLVLVDKMARCTKIIDIACMMDRHVT